MLQSPGMAAMWLDLWDFSSPECNKWLLDFNIIISYNIGITLCTWRGDEEEKK